MRDGFETVYLVVPFAFGLVMVPGLLLSMLVNATWRALVSAKRKARRDGQPARTGKRCGAPGVPERRAAAALSTLAARSHAATRRRSRTSRCKVASMSPISMSRSAMAWLRLRLAAGMREKSARRVASGSTSAWWRATMSAKADATDASRLQPPSRSGAETAGAAAVAR